MDNSPNLSKMKREGPAHCLCIHPWQSPPQNTASCPSAFSSGSNMASSYTRHSVWLALDFFSTTFGGVLVRSFLFSLIWASWILDCYTNGWQQCMSIKLAVLIVVEKWTPNVLYTLEISTKIIKRNKTIQGSWPKNNQAPRQSHDLALMLVTNF